MKLFTFVPGPEIVDIMAEHATNPGKRKAQHLLASEVLELVHGNDVATKTQAEHEALRNPDLAALTQWPTSAEAIDGAQAGQQRTVLPSSLVFNTPFSRILYHAGIVKSKSEGARMIAKGGAYVATASAGHATDRTLGVSSGKIQFVQLKDQRPQEVQQYITNDMLILRTGKWKVRVVEVVEDADFDAQGLDAPGWSELKASNSP